MDAIRSFSLSSGRIDRPPYWLVLGISMALVCLGAMIVGWGEAWQQHHLPLAVGCVGLLALIDAACGRRGG